ncbi:type IV pilus modification PilV family protein [Synechococcus elongatus]|uniref:type IV pilus modification PilV family protein n=1 Tax=Synechococcus elongatus TaxID=32046 RepID=UPI000F7DFF02|nr:hypothetical protein [Synechococcus elongatus]
MKRIHKRSRRSQLGFSLVEILVAAILTVLLAQATAAALRISVQTQNRASTENSFENAIVADLEQVRAINRNLCRNPNFDRTATTSPNNLSYGAFGDCAGTIFQERCRATGTTPGFGNLLQAQVPNFTSQTVIVNGQTWTISRQTLVPDRPLNSGDAGYAESSQSVLKVRYDLTRGSTTIAPAFVTEFVPDAVGSCQG